MQESYNGFTLKVPHAPTRPHTHLYWVEVLPHSLSEQVTKHMIPGEEVDRVTRVPFLPPSLPPSLPLSLLSHPVVVFKHQLLHSSLSSEQLNVALELGQGIAWVIVATECEPADLVEEEEVEGIGIL